MDVGFCIFAKRFATGNAWASALPDIASHIKAHQRLVNHWKAVLPLEMHSVAYEEIVGDQAGRQKALLEFLELPKGCDSISLEREYYEGRQISDRYIGHWKHYERHLVPLVEDFLLWFPLSRPHRRFLIAYVPGELLLRLQVLLMRAALPVWFITITFTPFSVTWLPLSRCSDRVSAFSCVSLTTIQLLIPEISDQ